MICAATRQTRGWFGRWAQRAGSWWDPSFALLLKAMLTLDSYECVCGTGTSGEFNQLHGLQVPGLDKLLVGAPWCNGVWYFRKVQSWDKTASVSGEEMGGRRVGPHNRVKKPRLFSGSKSWARWQKGALTPRQNLLRRGPVTTSLLTHPLPCPSAQGMRHGRQTNVLMSVVPGLS